MASNEKQNETPSTKERTMNATKITYKDRGGSRYDIYSDGELIGRCYKAYRYGYNYWKQSGSKILHTTRDDVARTILSDAVAK
jgi:hypothetical protein